MARREQPTQPSALRVVRAALAIALLAAAPAAATAQGAGFNTRGGERAPAAAPAADAGTDNVDDDVDDDVDDGDADIDGVDEGEPGAPEAPVTRDVSPAPPPEDEDGADTNTDDDAAGDADVVGPDDVDADDPEGFADPLDDPMLGAPPRHVIPEPNRDEPAVIPEPEQAAEPATRTIAPDTREAWTPELEGYTGIYFREGVAPGLHFGMVGAALQHWTGPTQELSSVRTTTRVFGQSSGAFWLDPTDGLDAMALELAPYAMRVHVASDDGAEWRTHDRFIGGVTIDRDRELRINLSTGFFLFSQRGTHVFQVRPRVALALHSRATLGGFEHIDFDGTPHEWFNGLRLGGGGVRIEPTFQAADIVFMRAFLGGDADISLGARDGTVIGARFASRALLNAITGFGMDVGDHVSGDVTLSYRGAIDSERNNTGGWRVGISVTGRY